MLIARFSVLTMSYVLRRSIPFCRVSRLWVRLNWRTLASVRLHVSSRPSKISVQPLEPWNSEDVISSVLTCKKSMVSQNKTFTINENVFPKVKVSSKNDTCTMIESDPVWKFCYSYWATICQFISYSIFLCLDFSDCQLHSMSLKDCKSSTDFWSKFSQIESFKELTIPDVPSGFVPLLLHNKLGKYYLRSAHFIWTVL